LAWFTSKASSPFQRACVNPVTSRLTKKTIEWFTSLLSSKSPSEGLRRQ
jgi:hypothetical protein